MLLKGKKNNMTEKTPSYRTTCCYCGVGCGMVVKKDARGKLTAVGDPAHPVNKGKLCAKGMTLHHTATDHTGRLLYPMLRDGQDKPFSRVSWDRAMDEAARKFRRIIAEHGPGAVGFYVSGQCLTEEYYLVNKIAKGFIGTANIDTNSRLCMSSAVSAYKLALGEDAVPGCYEDLELADTFLIAGANPAWCHPVLFARIEAHREKNSHVKVIVADPRRTETASAANLHLQLKPGTDIVLYHAIARGLIENGFTDEGFIRDHTEGFEALRGKVMERTLAEAASVCGVPLTDIYRAVKYIGASGGFISLWAMGLNQSTSGVDKNLALINLSLITGKIGRPGSGPFSLTGQANAMGGREVGGMATMLAAHRELGNADHRRQTAAYWKVPHVPAKPGLTATEMFRALKDGQMKAIWIICTNPAVSMPDAGQVEAALLQADFVVVQDMSLQADTVRFAHLALPAATWLEKEGTMTNSERRISHLARVLDPPGEALPDADIVVRFARAMGWGEQFCYEGMAGIYEEHARLTRDTPIDISGLNYETLQAAGSVQWPFPGGAASGTSRLFTDHMFYRPGGRAKIHAVSEEQAAEPLTPDTPLILTTGRIRDQWHTMTRTGKVNNLRQHTPAPFLEIHPADAAARNIREGDPVNVRNGRGELRVNAKLTGTVKRGVVFLPMHWGRLAGEKTALANNVTSMRTDPVSRQPGFKYSAVEVCRYEKPVQRIVIVGEGEEIIAFLKHYRGLNTSDQIDWFCRGNAVFRPAALWSDYITRGLDPPRQPGLGETAAALQVTLLKGVMPVKVDRTAKVITADDQRDYPYDKLILCAAHETPAFPLSGRLTLDSPESARQLRSLLAKGNALVLAGGDPQLLSLSAFLAGQDMEVHLVIGEDRLLGRLVDETASALMEEVLSQAGVQLHRATEVVRVTEGEGRRRAVLKSGRVIPCMAVVELPAAALPDRWLEMLGFEPGKRVRVDGYLRSRQPDIFSMGAAAKAGEEREAAAYRPGSGCAQARCLADYLHGNLLNDYRGAAPFYAFDLAGVPVRFAGRVGPAAGGPQQEEVVSVDRSRFYYKRCVLQGDRLVGAFFMGDDLEMAEYRILIEHGLELGEKREGLLRGGQGVALSGRVVCSCHQVGEENILSAIRGGCRTLAGLAEQTRAGTGCGSCKPELSNLLKKASGSR
jgi:ferredoxin-nitrate reductase